MCAVFSERDGAGQLSLLRLLLAYASAHADVGYCQGMAFVVAVLLTCVPPLPLPQLSTMRQSHS